MKDKNECESECCRMLKIDFILCEEETQKFDLPHPFLKLRFPGGAVAGVYLVERFLSVI